MGSKDKPAPKPAKKSFEGLLNVDDRLGGYVLRKKLGEGGFGAVFLVADKNGVEFAMKIESKEAKMQVVRVEVVILHQLNASSNRHFCKCDSFGHTAKLNYIVMELVGPSLQDLRVQRKSRMFSMASALRIGEQCIESIEFLHGLGYVHRDLKGANFAVGLHAKQMHHTVFLLDFGMARHYKREADTVRKPREMAPFRGTVRYAPLNAHLQREQSARDDMESWLYMHIEYAYGQLPWCAIAHKDLVGVTKMKARDPTTEEHKKLFMNCAPEIVMMMTYIGKDAPYFKPFDYMFFHNLIAVIYTRECHGDIADDRPFDWDDKMSAHDDVPKGGGKKTKPSTTTTPTTSPRGNNPHM